MRCDAPTCRAAWVLILLAAAGSAVPGTLRAQETRRRAVVEEIAGENIYLSVGVEASVATGDTLLIYRDREGPYLGALRVVASSSTRSVTVVVGEAFPVTRGVALWFEASGAVEPGASAFGGAGDARRTQRTGRGGPTAHGRLSLDFNGLQSTTRWLSNEWQETERWFATPGVGFRMTVTDLPGGLTFRASSRGLYRYSDPGIVEPDLAVHVYEMALTKAFTGVPVTVMAGRFASPYEFYSGYWDGGLLRIGGRTIGIGVTAGLQPRRADQAPSGDLPKYTVFADLALTGRGARYSTDLSYHRVLPRDEALFDRTFVGWSQSLRIGRLNLTSDVQADRDPEADEWRLSRLQGTGSLTLTRGVQLRGRYDRSRPYFLFRTTSLLPFARERISGGIGYYGARTAVNADVGMGRFEDGEWNMTYAASISVRQTAVFGLGLHASGSYWTQTAGNVVRATAGLTKAIGRGEIRGSYELSRSELYGPTVTSHAGVLGITAPLGARVYASFQARVQRGEHLRSNGLYASLWTSF
ncbi:MAG: hypothetical protein AMS20_02645 [Gemmatimonas sp. SG8_28]|nr:MAG: hypothetical protein AMS20_02645 [Gemmatimonas sp. SG8_28]